MLPHKHNAKCLKTENGYMVNFHGICFFVTNSFAYQVWCKTIECGMLPPTNEYGRLKALGLTQRRLTSIEEKQAGRIAVKITADPRYGVSKFQQKKKEAVKKICSFKELKSFSLSLLSAVA